jgi:hypothetical protein
MVSSNFSKTVGMLGQKLILVESRAHELSARFQTLRTKTELLKIDILKRGLESCTKSLARQAGLKSITRDGKKLKAGLVAAAAGAFLGGAFAKDWLSAFNSGISGFDGVLPGLCTCWSSSNWLPKQTHAMGKHAAPGNKTSDYYPTIASKVTLGNKMDKCDQVRMYFFLERIENKHPLTGKTVRDSIERGSCSHSDQRARRTLGR